MSTRSTTLRAFSIAGNLLYYPLLILIIALAATQFFPAVAWAATHLKVYAWFLGGMAAYFVLRRIRPLAVNEAWMQTFSHELSHTVVGMMFLHKIHSFRADERSGVMSHSGRGFGMIFISLAPYCLPLFTYLLLLLRILGAAKSLYIFDVLIGFTLAFHITCFWVQTRPYQTDIQGQGYGRSALFILACWIFNATAIIMAIRMGIVNAFCHMFKGYWHDLCSWVTFIFG